MRKKIEGEYMEFVSFFKQRKNITLLVAICAIVLGAITFILSMPFAFGPWITPATESTTESARYIAFIAFIGIFVSLAEVILGTALCTQKNRNNNSLIIPLLVILSTKLVLILVSIVIFGFAEISAFFYIMEFLLVIAAMVGILFNFFFIKDIDPEEMKVRIMETESKAKKAAEFKVVKESAIREAEKERATRMAAAATPPHPAPIPPFMSATPAPAPAPEETSPIGE